MKSKDSQAEAALRQYGHERERRAEQNCNPNDAQFNNIMAEVRRKNLPPSPKSNGGTSALQCLVEWISRRMSPLSVTVAVLIAVAIALPPLLTPRISYRSPALGPNVEEVKPLGTLTHTTHYWGLSLNPGETKGQTTGGSDPALEALVPAMVEVFPDFLKSTFQVHLADSSVLSGELKPDWDAPTAEKEKRFYVADVRGKTKASEPVEARVKLEYKLLGAGLGPANLTTNDIRWAKADVTLWNAKDTNKTVRFVREGIFSKAP